MVHMTMTSYPEMPMCQRGKSNLSVLKYKEVVQLTPDANSKGCKHRPEDELLMSV